MIKKIAFTYYSVKDLDKSLEFYQNTLGLKLLFKNDDWAEFEIDGQRIALHKKENIPSCGGAVVSFHADPIEEVIEQLKKKGVKFTEELQTFPYGKLAGFIDPDGNLVGLYQPPIKT